VYVFNSITALVKGSVIDGFSGVVNGTRDTYPSGAHSFSKYSSSVRSYPYVIE